jgi:hypothetical protein
VLCDLREFVAGEFVAGGSGAAEQRWEAFMTITEGRR